MPTTRAAVLIPRPALGIALALLAWIGAVSPAQADRGFGFRGPGFFHGPGFFRDRFFFGFNAFGFPLGYPWPAYPYYYSPAYYYPPFAYYPPPPAYPPPAAYDPAANGAPPPPPSYPPAASAAPPQAAAAGNCREFHQTINLDGQALRASGRVCQQPDGSWRIVP